jgi:glycine cleavage system H protein
MSEPLTFMMGDFVAEIPIDRKYAKNHMWATRTPEGCTRFGFSAYAVRLLQDIYFIDFSIDAGMTMDSKQEFGNIESKKAESGLYAPTAGRVVRLNQGLLDDPSVINVDKYGDGWLLEMDGVTDEFLTPQGYLEHLELAWEIAQRTIKGQANADDT